MLHFFKGPWKENVSLTHVHLFSFPSGIDSRSMPFHGTWIRDTSERSSTRPSLLNHSSGKICQTCSMVLFFSQCIRWMCALMKLLISSFFILKATHREAYSREGQESHLKEGNSGKTSGEVSSHESFITVKFHAQILQFKLGEALGCGEISVSHLLS